MIITGALAVDVNYKVFTNISIMAGNLEFRGMRQQFICKGVVTVTQLVIDLQ